MTGVVAATAVVVTGKLAVVAPAGTVTLAGRLATAGLALDSVTTVPPAGAAVPNVIVAVAEWPPTTGVGLRSSVSAAGGV